MNQKRSVYTNLRVRPEARSWLKSTAAMRQMDMVDLIDEVARKEFEKTLDEKRLEARRDLKFF